MKLTYERDPKPSRDPSFAFRMPGIPEERTSEAVRGYLQFFSDVEQWCVENIGRQDGRRNPNWMIVSTSKPARVRIRDATYASAFRMRWC